ncbi:MAG: hypothetical protein IAE82_15070 [Opitutaceae bacterium]|nr:hypothetical protein [Opitutaceae bacterium]
MHAHHRLGLSPATVLAGVLAITAALGTARAEPESSGAWMSYYGPALGLASEGLPDHSEWTDEVTATVADPARLTALGVDGVRRGAKVVLTNHDNGYWTIAPAGSDRKVTIPLGYLVRFGVLPDHDMSAERVPSRITGTVVAPEVLKEYAFRHPEKGESFTLQFEGGAWVLTLDAGPRREQQRVPF